MKLISFFLTTPQFLDGSKDVTRRLGWKTLTPGERLMAVRKAQGLRKGEHPEKLGEIEVVSVRREPLTEISVLDVRREGFPDLTRAGFIIMFCKHMGCQPAAEVARIEFRKVGAEK